ncbi:MAG: hypothetical protein AB7E26_04545 [Chryseobacterium sp.]
MKTTKNTIEYQIRKQIEEREISPSRNLWSEIESQTKMKSSGSRVNWFLMAACLVLTFSLGAVLFFNEENGQINKNKMTAHVIDVVSQDIKLEEKIKSNDSYIYNKPKTETYEKNIVSVEKAEMSDIPEALEQKELPLINKHITVTAAPVLSDKIIAQADSAKIPAKTRKYTDPSTLLFSIEHKDAIEQTKGTSNVASIEIIEK